MDNSTILFVATLAVAFVFLRWLIAPIPQSVPGEFNLPDPVVLSQSTSSRPSTARNRTRLITDSMIEVVQAIGPQLSVSQIRYSLERNGSVEDTVEEYMENGTLPFPPGEAPPSTRSDNSHDSKPNGEPQTLLEKYGLDEKKSIGSGVEEGKWGKDKDERISLLQSRREEMILRARKRIEQSLTNDLTSDLM